MRKRNKPLPDKRRELISVLARSLAVYLILTCVFSLHPVNSGSMEPAVRTSSMVIGWRLPFVFGKGNIRRGDIVIFRSDETGRYLLKRVIALSGDELEIKNGSVYLNGAELNEPYLLEPGCTEPSGPGNTLYQVPEESIFVMGDNRANSVDSRYFASPYIPAGAVYARAAAVFPLPRRLCALLCG